MKPSPCTPDRNDVVEIGGSDVVPVTVHRGGLICLLRQKLYLAQFRRTFCLGTLHPIFEEWVQLGVRAWYNATPNITGKMCLLDLILYISPPLRANRHNNFAEGHFPQ
jgi:hypothetical protein